jgi:hypothetical protein
MLPHKSVIINV